MPNFLNGSDFNTDNQNTQNTINPLTGLENPKFLNNPFDFNTSGGSVPVGKMFEGDSRYDIGITPTEVIDVNAYRAANQSNWAKAGNMLAAGVINAIPETIGNVAAIADIEDYLNQDQEIGNAVTRAMMDFQQNVEGKFPIYGSDKTDTFDLGDPNWWFKNGQSLLSSIGGFAITGAGTGALLSGLSKLGKTGQVAASTLSATMLNHAEGLKSAINVYDQVLKDTGDQQRAADAGAHVINLNRANIALNLTSANMFLKKPITTRSANLIREGGELAVKRSGALGEIIREAGQEALEEQINIIAEKEGELKGSDPNYKFSTARAIRTAFSKEGLEAAFLGALGGAGQTGITRAINKITGKTSKEDEISIKQQEVIDDRFNSIINSKEVPSTSTVFMNTAKIAEINKQINDELIKPEEERDETKIQNLQNVALGNQAFVAFETGATNALEDVYNRISNLSPEEAANKGLDVNEKSDYFYKKRANEAIESIKELETTYKQYKVGKYINSGAVFNNLVNKTNIQKELETITPEINEIETQINRDIDDLGFDVTDPGSNKNIEIQRKIHGLTPILTELKSKQKILQKDLSKNLKEFNNITSSEYQTKLKKKLDNAKTTAENKVAEKIVDETNIVNEKVNEAKVAAKANVVKQVNNKKVAETKKSIKTPSTDISQNPYAKESLEKLQSRKKQLESQKKDSERDYHLYLVNKAITNKQSNKKSVEQLQVPSQAFTEEDLQQVSTIETKKADIERRRQEELINSEQIYLNESIPIESFNKNVAPKINAKYDAELAALEKPIEETKPKQKAVDTVSKFMDIPSQEFTAEDLDQDPVPPEVSPEVEQQLGDIGFSQNIPDLPDNFDEIYEASNQPNIDKIDIESAAMKADIDQADQGYNENKVRQVEEGISNLITKLNEENQVESDYEHPKTPHNIFAYLSRNYIQYLDKDGKIKREDIDNLINEGILTTDILDPNKLPIGSKLRLEVDESYDGDIYSEYINENGTQTLLNWKQYSSELDTNSRKYKDNVPIAIYSGDTKVAYIHQVSWINDINNPDLSQKKLREEIDNLRNLRERIIKSPVEAIVDNKTPGILFEAVDGEQIPVSDAMPDDNLILAIGVNDKLQYGRDEKDTFDGDLVEWASVFNGVTHALAQASNGQYIPIYLHNTKMKNNTIVKNSIMTTLKTFYDNLDGLVTDEQRNIRDYILKETNDDIFNDEGISNYLRTFLLDVIGTDSLTDFFKRNSTTTDNYYLTISKGNVDFGRGGTQAFKDVKSINSGTPANLRSQLFDRFNKFLDNVYINSKLTTLGNNSNVVLIDTDNSTSTQKYYDFIKSNLTTEFRGINIGTDENPNYIYTIQPIIGFNYGEAIEESPFKSEKETKGKDIPSTTKVTPKINPLFKDTMKLDLTSDEQASPADEIDYDELVSEYIIPQLGLNRQIDLVKYMANVISEAVFNDQKIGGVEVFQAFKQQLLDNLEQFELYNLTNKAKYTKVAIDNFNKLEDLTVQYLEKLRGVSIETEQGDEASFEQTRYSEDSAFTQDSKNNLSDRMRRLYAGIPDYDDNGKQKISFAGTYKYMDFDSVYNTLHALVNNTEPDYKRILRRLEGFEIPFVDNVLTKLKNAPKSVKNAFVRDITKVPNQMRFVLFNKKKDGSYVMTVTDSNNSDIARQIQDNWSNSILSNDIIETKDGEYYISETKANELISQFDKYIDSKKGISDLEGVKSWYKGWLEEFGIKLTNDTYGKLENGKINGKNFRQQFSNSDGIFKQLYRSINNNKGKVYTGSEIFSTKNKSLINLSKNEAANSLSVYSNSFRDGNKTIYTYILPKYLHNRMRELKTDIELLKFLDNTPFASTSEWLNKLVKRDEDGEIIGIEEDSDFYNAFKVHAVGLQSIKERFTPNRDDLSMSDNGELEHEVIKLAMFMRSSNVLDVENRTAEFFYPTTSDKSVVHVIQTKVFNASGNLDNLLDRLYNSIVQPDINRIKAHRNKNIDIDGYNPNLFYLFPKLNNLKLAVGTDEFRIAAKGELKTLINTLVDEKLTKWRDLGIGESYEVDGKKIKNSFLDDTYVGKIAQGDLRRAAQDYVINNLVANANMMQLFTGDPALFYKSKSTNPIQQVIDTFDNMGKRLAKDIAPGYEINDRTSYKQGFLLDREGNNSLIKDYYKSLGYDYSNINGTDAQEFTTLKEHINIMHKAGDLDDKTFVAVSAKIRNKSELTKEEIGKVLQPMKPVYVDNIKDKVNGIDRIVYIKSSSIPLIPELTKGLEVDKLRIAMERDKVSRVAFSSAVKLGNVKNPLKIFNDDGTIMDNLVFDNTNTLMLNRKGFRIQQEIPIKDDTNINVGTQSRKLLFVDLLENDTMKSLKESYDKQWNKLIDLETENLKEELGITEDTPYPNIEKLQKILLKEAKERGYNFNDVLGLQLQDNQFKIPLWASPSSDKYEALLSSIVTNRVLKQKFPGKSYILATEEGFQGESEGIVYTSAYTGKLLPMRVENGKVLPGQVIIPFKFKDENGNFMKATDFINPKTGRIDSSRLPKKLLQMAGFRIPTQGHNSMTNLEVVGFLPETMGDTIIASRDLVTQMGSDFDVDKLYTYMYNYTKSGNNLTIDNSSEKLSAQNSILDIHMKVLSDVEIFKNKVLKPVGEGKLKELADELQRLTSKDNEYFTGISDEYQKTKYLNAKGAKKGVGAFALDNTLNAALQQYDIILTNPDKTAFTVKIGNKTSTGNLSTKETLNNSGRTKSEIISAFLSAAVDNEKLQVFDKINANNYTFDVIKVLNQLGFEEDATVLLINQPVIKEYVDKVAKMKSSLNDYTENAEDKVIDELLSKYKEGEPDLLLSTMRDNIENTTSSNNFEANQHEAIRLFDELRRQGLKLRKIQSVINIDSAGLDKSMFINNAKAETIYDIIENSPEFGKLVTEGLIGSFNKALLFNNKIWSKEFPTTSDAINSATNEILQVIGQRDMSSTQRGDLEYRIFKDLLSYIYSDNELGITESNESLNDLRKRLMLDSKDNKSLPTRVSDLKSTGLNNPLINMMYDEFNKNGQPSLLLYKNSAGANFDETNLYLGFIELLRNEDTRSLAKDMISYAYLTGGVQQATQFVKYVPISYLENIEFANKLRNVGFNNGLINSTGSVNNPYDISTFTYQWIQHNGQKLVKFTDKDVEKVGDGELKLTNDEKLVVVKGYKDPVSPVAISRYDPKVSGRYEIYLYDGESRTYKRIPTKGFKKGIKEYSFNQDIPSFINNNNPSKYNKVVASNKNKPAESTAHPVWSQKFFTEADKAKTHQDRVANVLNKAKENITNSYYSTLIDHVLDNIDSFNIKKFVFSNSTSDNKATHKNGIITIYTKNIKGDNDFIKSLLHELYHSGTTSLIDRYLNGDKTLPSNVIDAIRRLDVTRNSLINKIKRGEIDGYNVEDLNKVIDATKKGNSPANLGVKDWRKYYALANLHEFVSESITMESTPHSQLLQSTEYNEGKTFIQKVFRHFMELLEAAGLIPSDNKTSALYGAINDILDISSYNDNKDSLAESTQASPAEGGGKFNTAIDSKKKQLREVNKRLTIKKNQLKTVKDTGEYNSVLKSIDSINNQIDRLNNELDELQKSNSFEYLQDVAMKDMDEMERYLSQEELSADQLDYVKRTLNTWTSVSNYSNPNHAFLTDEDLESSTIVGILDNIHNRASMLNLKLNDKNKQWLESFVNQWNSRDWTIDEIMKEIPDISKLKELTRSIGEVNHPIFNAVFKAIKGSNVEARRASNDIWEEIEITIDKVLPKLRKLNPKDPFNFIKQERPNGTKTGNLVNLFDQSFFDKIKNLRYNAFKKSNKTTRDVKAYNDFKSKYLVDFDPRKLIPDSNIENGTIPSNYISKDLSSYSEDLKKDLINSLGQEEFDKYMERFNEKIEGFKFERQAAWDRISEENISDVEKKARFKEWLVQKSPYILMDSHKNINVLKNPKGKFYKNISSYEYTYSIPRRVVDGKNTGFYDKKYDAIKSDSDLKKLYDLTYDILNEVRSIIPSGVVNGLQINTMPHIEKTIIDMFSEKGIRMGIAPFWDKVKELTRSDDLNTIISSDIDPLTGNREKQLRLNLIRDYEPEINEYVELKMIQYRQENGKLPKDYAKIQELRNKFRDEKLDQIADSKSWDLGKVLKAYYLMGQMYKHKSVIETDIKLASELFNNIKELETNSAGEGYRSNTGKTVTTEGLNNMKKMLEYFVDTTLYDLPTHKVEGKGKAKILTSEEKQKQSELEGTINNLKQEFTEGKIDEESYNFELKKLNNQLESLGGVFTGSRFGDLLLKYMQLKGMGYNFFAGLANVGFGTIANWIEASANQFYGHKEMREAYGIVMSSIGKYWSGGKLFNSKADKVTNTMRVLDVLKDASNEIFERQDSNSFTKGLKRFGPYQPQKRSEYVNQASLMIAMMKKNIKNDISMWDATDSNGKIKEEYKDLFSSEDITKFQLKLDQVIKRNHGNYDPDSKLQAKESWLGRALLQFRTWALEGVSTRFEKERTDDILETTLKGRYRSFLSKDISEATGMNHLQTTLFHISQLCRKLIGMNTKYDEKGFSETDAANMRRNLTELVVLMNLMGLGLLLRAVAGTDDEDEKPYILPLNFAINQLNRLETDILFYTNPKEADRLLKSPIPIMALVTDTYDLAHAIGRQFDPDLRTMQSGPMEGWNAFAKEGMEWLPFANQVPRLVKNAKQFYD